THAKQSAHTSLGQFYAIGTRHLLPAVLAQGMCNLVPHYSGNFCVGQLQLVDQPAVKNDLATRPTIGIDFGAVNQVDLPLPVAGILTKIRRLGNQPLCNSLQTASLCTAGVQLALATGFLQSF